MQRTLYIRERSEHLFEKALELMRKRDPDISMSRTIERIIERWVADAEEQRRIPIREVDEHPQDPT